MASKLKIRVNGLVHSVSASLDTPLLYVLHNELHLHGPRFGCGLAQCGACSVLLNGKEIRSCVTPVGAVGTKRVVTLEGLATLWARERSVTSTTPDLHPLQHAWIDPTAVSRTHLGTVPGPPDPAQIDSWLQVNPDNTVTLFHGWTEMGQGSPTAIRQIAAEELGLSLDQVTAAQLDTNVSVQAFAAASSSTRTAILPTSMRGAAAAARTVLVGMAAAQLGVPASALSVTTGVVPGGGKR